MTLRVHAFTKTVPAPRGYIGTEEVHVQQLQSWDGVYWRTIDEEIVPGHVKISMGAFGDTGGWKSKFAGLGTFGRDGIIRQQGESA